jgi:hypothetical protein
VPAKIIEVQQKYGEMMLVANTFNTLCKRYEKFYVDKFNKLHIPQVYNENKKRNCKLLCTYRCVQVTSKLLGFEEYLDIIALSVEHQEYLDFHNLNQG